MWLPISFAALGFLIGNLVGLSAQSLVTSLLGLLFAFGGGSVIALLQQLNAEARLIAGQSIFALSISCVVGLYTGIVVSERQIFSPSAMQTRRESVEARKYLRSETAEVANAVDAQLRLGKLTHEQAYDILFQELTAPAAK